MRPLAAPLAALVALTACDRSRPDLGGTDFVASASASSTTTTDFKSIAAKVVGQSVAVRENEVVELAGDVADLPLLEELAVEVRKRGAHPIILVTTDRLARRLFDEVPAKYDSQPPLGSRKLTEVADVFIATESGEARTLRGVAPQRQAARARAFQPIFALAQKRGVRSVNLGNGLYPTEERAEQLGMRREELAALMYGGIDADYSVLQATGKRLEAALSRGKEVRITGPAGTALRIGIAGRPVYVSDGVISPEDRKRGGSALSVWLPAGEVYLTLAPGSAEGTLVAERHHHEGQPIEGLRLDIKAGKVAGMSATSGLEPLKARYDAASRGRDLVSVVDFGINPSVKVPEGKGVNAWSRAGAVTVVIGNDQWAGGTNTTDFSIPAEIARATVTVDGTPLVQDGKLVEAPANAAR